MTRQTKNGFRTAKNGRGRGRAQSGQRGGTAAADMQQEVVNPSISTALFPPHVLAQAGLPQSTETSNTPTEPISVPTSLLPKIQQLIKDQAFLEQLSKKTTDREHPWY